MMNTLHDAIVSIVNAILNDRRSAIPRLFVGKYVGTDPADVSGNLIQVTVNGQDHRFVQKLGSVTYAVGDNVLLIKGGSVPLTALAPILGNATIADLGQSQ